MQLKDTVQKIRSQNAGPFWVSVDVFCGSPEAFANVSYSLETSAVAAVFSVPAEGMKRFEIPPLYTIKISFPVRPRKGHGWIATCTARSLRIYWRNYPFRLIFISAFNT